MKKHRLMLSAATAALIAVPLAGVALADTDITTNTKGQLVTSTAGNISIESGGSVAIKAADAAITLNSANFVAVNSGGVISNLNTANAYGVLVDTSGGNVISPNGAGFEDAGTIDMSGTGTNKAGITVLGGNTFLGSLTLIGAASGATGNVMNVEGDDSITVFLASGTTMDGNIELGGSMTQTTSAKNSDNVATRMIGIDGVLNGSISVDGGSVLTNVGQGARGITILGQMHAANCTGDAALYTASGQACPSTTSYGALINSGTVVTLGTENISSKNVNPEAGAALVVGASIDGGIEISGSSTGLINTFQGSFSGAGTVEPVVLFDPNQPTITGIFGAVQPVKIGVINSATDPSDGAPIGTTSCAANSSGATPLCYSFINRGLIRAQPIDPELSTTAMSIVGASAANNVFFAGGLLNTGTLSATATTTKQSHSAATDIAATALYIGPNSVVPNITVAAENTTGTSTTPGNITAQVAGSGGGDATAIQLGLGAQVPTINVSQHATVAAAVNTTTLSPTNDIANTGTPFSLIAQAIVDQSGFLKNINNGGSIIASTSQLDPAVGAVTNVINHAINLSLGNASNVTINNTGTILGDVLFGAASNHDVFNVGNYNQAVIDATGNTATAGGYAIVANRLDSVSGAAPVTEANTINFGSGTGDALNVGAFGFVNSIIKAASPGAVDINLATSGVLAIANAASDGTVNANAFNILGGTLVMPLAQSTTTVPVPVVTANSAHLTAAATLGTQFTSFFSSGFTTDSVNNPAAQQIVLIKTPQGALTLDPGVLDDDNANLSANLPFLFRATPTPLSYVPTIGTSSELILTLTPKTPTELGLTGDAAALFPNASASLVSDPLLGAAIANNITVRDAGGAINVAASKAQAQALFSQFSPDVSGGARQVAIMLTDQATGPVAARQRLLRSYARQPGEMTLWSDEFAGMINNKGRVDADGSLTDYKDHGFGFSVGMDAGSPLGGWYGGAFTFYTGDISQTLPRTTKTDTQWYMLTGYTEWHGKHVFLDTKADVGYGDLVGHRDMVVGNQARDALGKRAGLVASLGATTGVDLKYGGFGVMPHISLDGMTLRENGYYETNGQAMDLQVAPYYGNSLRGAFGVDFKTALNMWDVTVTPEARFGYRYDMVSAPVKIKAGFISTGGLNATGNSFTFVGPDPDTGNVLAGFSLGAGTDTWQLGVNYDWLRGNNGSTTQTGTLTILARI